MQNFGFAAGYASHQKRKLTKVPPICLNESSVPDLSEDGSDVSCDLHFLQPAPDSPVPSIMESPRGSVSRVSQLGETALDLHTSDEHPLFPFPLSSDTTDMTFDTFMSALDSSPKVSQKPKAEAVSVKYTEVFRMRVSRIKREAADREKNRQKRQEAARKIQTWYLKVKGKRLEKEEKRKVLMEKIEKIGRKIRERQAARRIEKAIRQYVKRRKGLKLEIWKKYRNLCATLIQKTFRGFQSRKSFKSAMVQKRRFALALLQGLKTRRVLRTKEMKDVKDRISLSKDPLELSELKTEFLILFETKMKTSAWKKSDSGHMKKTFLKRGRGRIGAQLNPKDRSGDTTVTPSSTDNSRDPSFSWSSSQTPRMKSLSTNRKPSFSAIANIASDPPQPVFLKRRTSHISPQPLNWNKVKSRIDCWGPKEPKTSLEEFQRLEKQVSRPRGRRKIPIPMKENVLKSIAETTEDRESVIKRPVMELNLALDDSFQGSAGTTEAPSVPETAKSIHNPMYLLDQPSHIPRLTPESVFISSLRRISSLQEYEEIRALLQEAFSIIK